MGKINTLVLVTLLFAFTVSYGQVTSGIVEYRVTHNKEKALENLGDEEASSEVLDRVNSIMSSASDVMVSLEFTDTASVSKGVESLNVTNQPNLVSFSSGGSHYVYTNAKDGEVLSANGWGDLIIRQERLEWEVEKESKLIGDFICFKATASVKKGNTGGVFYDNITAWYTKQIPLPYGPYVYSGLPGLIIEVISNKGTIKYKAEKITLNPKKELRIRRPKGKITTKREADSILKRNYGKLFKN